eukprot:sb/3475835/
MTFNMPVSMGTNSVAMATVLLALKGGKRTTRRSKVRKNGLSDSEKSIPAVSDILITQPQLQVPEDYGLEVEGRLLSRIQSRVSEYRAAVGERESGYKEFRGGPQDVSRVTPNGAGRGRKEAA